MSIKYYHLAKDEKLPDEFCAIRDVGGEPSEYTFYAPEAENAKLRHDLEEANNQAEEVCIENAKLREIVADAWGYINHPANDTWTHKKRKEVRVSLGNRMRELGVGDDA